MSRRLFSPCGRLLTLVLGAGLATGVAAAQPVGQGQPTPGAAPPSSPSPPAASVPAPTDAAGTPAPGAAVPPAGPSAAPTATPVKTPPAAASPKPSPQSRAVLSQVEKRITDLHERLHITAAQQPLWDGFAETMRQNARDMDAAADQRRRGTEAMTALADMQSYADLAQMHAAQMGKLVSAFAKLYDAMPDEQKKQADAAFKSFQSQASAGRRPS